MSNDLTLEGLTQRVNANRQRQKERYELAKSLGFTTAEAVILQNHPEATIHRLADERKNKQQG